MFNFISVEYFLYKLFLSEYSVLITVVALLCCVSIFLIRSKRVIDVFKKNRVNILLSVITIITFFLILEMGFRLVYKTETDISYITGSFVYEENTFEEEKTENIFRIVALGDSFTRGGGVENEEQAYPYQLEQILNKNTKNFVYKVYDLGFGGINTYQELLILEKEGLRYHPDMLILQYHPNDVSPPPIPITINDYTFLIPNSKKFVSIDQELIPILVPLPSGIDELILHHSYFLRFTSKRLDNIYSIITKDSSENEKWARLNFDSLEKIIEISKEKNIPLMIIFVSGANPNMCDKLQLAKSGIKSIALQNNIHFIDLCDYIEDYDLSEIKSKNDCDVCDHYNEKGYRIMAEAIFENIQKLGFV